MGNDGGFKAGLLRVRLADAMGRIKAAAGEKKSVDAQGADTHFREHAMESASLGIVDPAKEDDLDVIADGELLDDPDRVGNDTQAELFRQVPG